MKALSLLAFALAFLAFAVLFPFIALTWLVLALIFGVGVGRRLKNSAARRDRGHDVRDEHSPWSGQILQSPVTKRAGSDTGRPALFSAPGRARELNSAERWHARDAEGDAVRLHAVSQSTGRVEACSRNRRMRFTA